MVKIPYHYQQNTGDNQDQFHGYHISHRTKKKDGKRHGTGSNDMYDGEHTPHFGWVGDFLDKDGLGSGYYRHEKARYPHYDKINCEVPSYPHQTECQAKGSQRYGDGSDLVFKIPVKRNKDTANDRTHTPNNLVGCKIPDITPKTSLYHKRCQYGRRCEKEERKA